MANTWSRSWALARQSLAVLRSQPELSAFPIVSGIATLGVTVSFALPAYLAMAGKDLSRGLPVIGYVLLALYYLLSYFVIVFFNVAMTKCVHAALRSGRMSFGEGLRAAKRHMPAILGWSLIAATVGMILNIVSDRLGIVGKIIVGLLGATWNVITFFVVPLLALEDRGPVTAVKESGMLLKRTWGERLIGLGGVGLAIFAVTLIPVPFLILLASLQIWTAFAVFLVLSVLFWLTLATVGASLTSIYQTTLFVYATQGSVPAAFESSLIVGAFSSKPESKVSRLLK